MNDILRVYKGKRVLVTGHTGFKGSWLSIWLKELGAEVIGYSLNPPTKPNLFDSIGLEKQINNVIGDIRDPKKLFPVFKECKPEIVFHLAAQPFVRLSYREPKLTYEINVMGTVNVLEAVRGTSSARACIVITSDKCYENRESKSGYKESAPLGGYDPYSSSKACCELVAGAYRKSYFNGGSGGKCRTVLATARAGNVIGGGDWGQDRLVPDSIKALTAGRTISIRSPNAIRPWQYVLDPLGGYLSLGAMLYTEGQKYSGAWNFGPGNSNTLNVKEVVELIIRHWGTGKYLVDKSEHPHETNMLKLNSSKARKLLNWSPSYGVSDALDRTVKWYKLFYTDKNRENPKNYVVNEIRDYMKRNIH